MKKLILIASFGMFGVLTLGSCKKDWTCQCTMEGTLLPYSENNTKNMTRQQAKTSCEKNNTTIPGASVDCRLK